jgi:hypothetical protein
MARSPYLYPPGTGFYPVIPKALGSLFVASYDSQGYSGGIRPPPPHKGELLNFCPIDLPSHVLFLCSSIVGSVFDAVVS